MYNLKLINKSSVNLYRQCPFKWKCIHVEELPTTSSPMQERGTRIHKKIEEFYKKFQPDEEIRNFIHFESERIKSCVKDGFVEHKYFFPMFQELTLVNEQIGLKGTIDAVYLNPKDDGVIVLDFKTGHYSEKELDFYRFELAVYKELLERSGKVDKVKYWAIYFTDADKLFFEEVNEEYIDRMYATVNQTRDKIENKEFEPQRNMYCKYCDFKDKCNLLK